LTKQTVVFRNFATASKNVSEKFPLYRVEMLAGFAFHNPTLILIWTLSNTKDCYPLYRGVVCRFVSEVCDSLSKQAEIVHGRRQLATKSVTGGQFAGVCR